MLIILIVANLALTVGLMTMVKETKKINKEIEDIGFNIAHMQRNVTELGYSNTFVNKSISELHNRVENNTEVLGNSICENNAKLIDKIISLDFKLDNVQTTGIELSADIKEELGRNLEESKQELIKNNKEEMAKFLVKLTFTPLKIMEIKK